MKKALSVLLSVVIVLTAIVPGFLGLDFATFKAEAATSGAGDAYATLFTMSDLQSNGYMQNVRQLISTLRDDGVTETPDALLFGGDFQTTSNAEEDISHHMDAMERVFNDFYPYYHSENLVFIKGNHDLRDERHYETGLYEFDNFYVYVINEDDYTAGNLNDAQTASANLKLALDRLLASNNDKPVFVMTHVPFHHNSRGDYGQSAYGRYLFNVLNTYGNFMDIVFMFGHNHSGNYDDYIGGSVNFLGVGDTIYISEYGLNGSTNYGEEYYTPEKLTFTYMNYGYAAYNNNTNGPVTDIHTGNTVQSTNATTMGVIEICPDRIVVNRYTIDDEKAGTEAGRYGDAEIITRKTPTNEDGSYDDPYVRVAHHFAYISGVQYAAYANATGFENPVYKWESSHPDIVRATGDGPIAQVAFLQQSDTEVTVKVTVTESGNSSKKAEDSYSFKVDSTTPDRGSHVLLADSTVTNKTLEYYSVDLPFEINLVGYYASSNGANAVTNQKWSSSNNSVATVNNGQVVFSQNGTATITYSVNIDGETYNSPVTFVVSNGAKLDLKYVQVDPSTFTAGKSYIFGSTYNHTQIFSDNLTTNANDGYQPQYVLDGTSMSFEGTVGSYWFTLNDPSYVWNAVESSTAGRYNLQNAASGLYLRGEELVKTDGVTTSNYYGTFAIGTEKNTTSSLWYYDTATGVFKNGYNFAPYMRTNTYQLSSETGRMSYFLLFEQADTGSEAHIELGGEYVEGKTEYIYNVTNDTQIRVYGDYTNYGSDVKETWSSSDESVATISSDGTIDFTGVAGDTVITYKIKSTNVQEQELTFTLSAKTDDEHKRTFKLVDKIVDDRPYVFVRKNDITEGEGYAMSTNKLTKNALFPEDIVIKHNPVNDYLYVEVPESEEDNLVWTTGGDIANGFVYVTTERSIRYTWWQDLNGDGNQGSYEDGELFDTDDYVEGLGDCVGVNNGMPTTEYLGVQVTGMGEWGVEGSLYLLPYSEVQAGRVTDFNPHMFNYKSHELFSNHDADVVYSKDTSKTYKGKSAVAYHSSGYFGVGEVNDSSSMLLAFEEVFPEPTAVIESNYEYIGKNVTRDEICPGQTEQLTAVPENFPDGTKTYTWSSSDTTVATVDQNGKVTYTGKAGVTEITLTIKNTSDVAENNVSDTQTVTITVNPSQIEIEDDGNKYYLTTDNFVPGNEYVIAHKNTDQTGENASKNDSLYYAISNGRYNNNLAKGEVTTVTEAATNYVENPSASTVWKAVDSGVDGYVYLVDQDGNYLAIYYSSGSEDLIRSFASMDDVTTDGGESVPADSFLIRTDGTYLYSKQSGTRGVVFNYGSSATSTKRFSVSSGMSKFGIYGKTASVYTDAYYLTDTLVDGKKYVISNQNTENDLALAIGNVDYQRSAGPMNKHAVNEPVKVLGGETFISKPAEKTVWECIASPEAGYFYLKSIEDGKYLVANYSDTATEKKLTSAATLYEFGDPDAYLFQYRKSSDGTMVLNSKQTRASSAYVNAEDWGNGSGAFGVSTSKTALYLYALKEEEVVLTVPVTQIRENGREGTSKDISNTIVNRYNVKSGDTEMLLRYIVNVEDGYTYKWASSDTSIATVAQDGTVTYTGKEGYTSISLTVNGTDAQGNAYSDSVWTTIRTFSGGYVLDTNDYPEYPYEGSVRVNKTASNSVGGKSFQNTGVTEVELGVTGVPLAQPLDVVVVLDHSSSMNSGTMLEDCIENTQNFVLQLLDANPNNRVAVVTFDAFSQYYPSIGSATSNSSKQSKEAGVVTGDGTVAGAFVTREDESMMMEQIEALITNNESNTNYDYGMKLAYDILAYAQEHDGNDNQVVVFMSDGQPNQFNGLQIGSTDLDKAWLTGDETYTELASYLANTATYPAAKLFNADGDNWYAAAIKAPKGSTVAVPDHTFYDDYETGLGAKVFTIGYAVTDTYGLLGRMASSHANYYYAADNLQPAYDEILTQILQAADDAVVTDKMGPQFDVQFATSFEMSGSGTVTLNPVPKFEVGYWTLDGNGNRISYNIIETITFTTNGNGILTGATSTIIGDCYDTNGSIINGQYVSYDLNAETFTWNVGEINRTELTLKYYACLEGAAKGEREAGTFDTNEYATLAYTNYRGNACTKTFPVPTLAWKRAAISYEFYLVNEAGQPVNLNGVVVPFTDRIIIGREQTKQIALSGSADYTQYTLVANTELPDGYELFNPYATFIVNIPNSSAAGQAIIDDSTKTTYYRDGSTTVNVYGPVPGVTDCDNTAVSFAVKMSKGVIPDTVVVDYGLPVRIQVLGNDYYVEGASITGVAGAVTADTKLNSFGYTTSQLDTSVALKYGSVETKTDGYDLGFYYPEYIVYTPNTTNMPAEEVFYYEYKVGDTYYYTSVTVIPAANIYYEESFMTFTDGKDGTYKWENVGETLADKFQAEDRPGTFAFDIFDADNAYGEDEAYNDSFTYSLGSAKKTTVDSKAFGKEPSATFTFSGTGFDLFSVTSNDTGAILVTITDEDDKAKSYLVNTYYGYTVDENGNNVPSTGADNAVYQVPVISKRDLNYGTYTVTIKPMYSSAFDPNYDKDTKTGDYSIFVDSVRIFNPAGDVAENSTIGDAYLKDGEYAPAFKSLRETVLTAEEYYDEFIANLELGYTGSIFIDGKASNGIGESDIATYKEQGPNNELYLGKNQAVAFLASAKDMLTLESLQLGMKVVSGGETAEVVVMNSSEKFPNSFTVSGAHETFKKLNSAIIWDQTRIDADERTYETLYPIVIANVSDTVISLTTFKWAHTTDPVSDSSVAPIDITVNGLTAEQATLALRNAMAATEESAETGTYDETDVSIEWGNETFTEGKEATLKVTTPPEVVKVTVDGIEITDCTIGENGEKIWSYSFVVKQSGENTYDVVLYDYNNEASDPIKTETIYVEEAEDEPTTDEPTTDEPTTDEPTTDEPTTDGSDEGTMSEWERIFKSILDFFKRVINFIWRIFA